MKLWSSTYRLLTDLAAPAISLYLLKRRREGREDAERFGERLGQASQPRPPGRLIWCHAASVGEVASLMTLVGKILDIYPDISVLITSGTVTSARMLQGRLPPKVTHQYMPVDRVPYVKSFLDHWRPDFALWIESELWPNMLAEIRKRVIPAVLLNARMSEKSFRNWYRVKKWAQEILGTFDLCLTQTEEERSRFVALGARKAKCFGNLKFTSQPLPCDEASLTSLKQTLAGRISWVMASTHRGEEEMALTAHRALRAKYPNLLTLIAPRHAVRGPEIAARIRELGLSCAQRSQGETPTAETEIYLADTMGELGLLYRLSPIACVGGSFVPVGGHNLIEPAQLGCAIIFGPYMHNFAEIAREFLRQEAGIQLQNANEIAFTLERLLGDAAARARFAQSARAIADHKRHVLDQIMHALEPWLSAPSRRAA